MALSNGWSNGRVLALNDREPRKNEFGIILVRRMAVTESDKLLARMQTAKARKGMVAAFNASQVELGRAAVNAARKEIRHSQKHAGTAWR